MPRKRLRFLHPANSLPFLSLIAHDSVTDDGQAAPTFGVHHGTAVLACQIIACNEEGYLSTSKERNDQDARAPASLEALLTSTTYFYHLDAVPTDNSDSLYPLCLDFRLWRYPHQQLPISWRRQDHIPDDELLPTSTWSVISGAVKTRDRMYCRISNWRDAVQTARIIPKEHELWMTKNNMSLYMPMECFPLNIYSGNLFTLRADLHILFDQAIFAIVPKGDQMVVHFLRESCDAATPFHNTPFQDTSLLHDFLFARFAWTVIKISDYVVSIDIRKEFRILEHERDEENIGESSGHKNKGDEGHKMKQRKLGNVRKDVKVKEAGRKRSKQRAADNSAHAMSLEAGQSNSHDEGETVNLDARELARDIGLARKVHPFFLDPDGQAGGWKYENLGWYPGLSVTERKKRDYMDSHPNIRARSSATAISTGDDVPDDDDESVAIDCDVT